MQREHFDHIQSRIDNLLYNESGKADLTAVYQCCVQLLISVISSIKRSVRGDGFKDAEEEIWFFKEEAPRIWGLYLYYQRLVEVEAWRKSRSIEKFRDLLVHELKKAEIFPDEHSICEYYYQGRTDFDEVYFTRKHISQWSEGGLGMFLDPDIPVESYWLSHMRACELLREWLQEVLSEVEYQLSGNGGRMRLLCKLTPTDAIELFKGLHELKCFGNMPFKYVMNWVKEMMGIDVGNHQVILGQIANRKKKELFVDKIRDRLIEFMESNQ